MRALMVKALPGLAAGTLAKALEKHFAIVASDIVFAGDVEHFLLAKALKDLVQCVKFGGFGKVREVTCVENKIRLLDGRVDLVDSQLQGAVDVSIRRLVEADVAVADLNERKIGFVLAVRRTEELRAGHSFCERPYDSGAGPLHALEKTAAVHFVIGFET